MNGVSTTYPLVDLKIPEGVKEIRPYAYQDGEDLRSVSIPASVTKIGEGAFDGCINLEEIMVHPDNRVYQDCSCGLLFSKDETRLIRVPENYHGVIMLDAPLKIIEEGAFKDCRSFNEVLCAEALYPMLLDAVEDANALNINLYDDTGVLFGTDKKLMGPVLWPICGSYRVPETVEEIHNMDPILMNSEMPDFTDIIIHAGVRKISPNAFSRCPNLTIHAPLGSYALQYAQEQAIPYRIL